MNSQNRWLVLTILSSALFLVVIDMTILYTALPTLTHELRASATEKLWIINAYPLVVAGLLPGAGAIGDRFGHKILFVEGLAVFGGASMLAAFAPAPAMLITARVLLAVGAAMMLPATLSIIRHTFDDPGERSIAIGIWAAIASGGAALGPVAGGFLLEHFWWGSVFLVNVPIVLVAFVLALRCISRQEANPNRPFDLLASIQVMVGLVGLTYAVKEASKRVPSVEHAVVATVIGVLAMVLFVRRQRTSSAPIIDFALFRNSRFSAGVAAAVVTSAVVSGLELAVSQRLQLVLGMSPLQAGLFILPIPLAAFVAGPLAGVAASKWGSDKVLLAAMVLTSLGALAYLLGFRSTVLVQVVAFGFLGFGFGAAMTAASTSIMQNAPEHSAGMAASIEEVSYELGGALGITLLGSLMSAIYTASFHLIPGDGIPMNVQDGIDEAILASEGLAQERASALITAAHSAFSDAFLAVLTAALALVLVTSLGIAVSLQRRSG